VIALTGHRFIQGCIMSLPAIVSSAPVSPLPGPAGLPSGEAAPQDFASLLSAQMSPAAEVAPGLPALPTAELAALLDEAGLALPAEHFPQPNYEAGLAFPK
jgi:hypothetical protein